MTIILKKTEQLMHQLNELKNTYEEGKEPAKDRAFFLYVKQETEPIFHLLDEWEALAIDLINKQQISIHEQQIHATKDNMKRLMMHSYYADVRKRRYMDIYKSCKYIFNQLLKETK